MIHKIVQDIWQTMEASIQLKFDWGQRQSIDGAGKKICSELGGYDHLKPRLKLFMK